LPLMGWGAGHVQALSGGTPGRSPMLCPTACVIGRGGAVAFTVSTLLGRLGHAARICCRDRAISCPGMSSQHSTAFSISSEIFGGILAARCPIPAHESSHVRRAWRARSYEGREHPANPTAARRRCRVGRARLLNYVVRPQQYRLRDRQSESLSCLQVDDEFKLCRLLHWKIGRLGSFQDFVHVASGAPI
jgi:hypothetical protein